MKSLSNFTNTLLINEMKFKSADLINSCPFIKESTAELISTHLNKNEYINSSTSCNGIVFEFYGFTVDHRKIEISIFENSLANRINIQINETSNNGSKNSNTLEFRPKQIKNDVAEILENYEKQKQ